MRAELRRADAYLADGQPKAAARTYDDVLERRPDEPRALLGAAEAWSLAGESERALARAEAARAAGVPGADLALARALVQRGRGAEARPLLEGSTGPAAAVQAEALLAAGQADLALAAVQRADDAPATVVLGAWIRWRAEGEAGCPAAIEQARAAAGAAYEDPAVLGEAAAVLRACADAEGAADLAREARAFYLDGPEPLRQVAAVRQEGGDAENAARLLARAAALYPDEGVVARDLGVLWLAAGAPALAAAELLRALPMPPYEQDLARHATIIGGYGMEAPARQALCRDLWRSAALALDGTGDRVNAAAARERALRLDPDAGAAPWTALALEWSALGQHTLAEQAGRTALQFDGASPAVWLAMAEVAWASGHASESAGYARRAWELQPGSPEIAVRLAESDLRAGDPAEARRVIETALRDLRGATHPLSVRLQQLLAEAERTGGG